MRAPSCPSTPGNHTARSFRGATSKLPVRVCDRDGSTTASRPPLFTQISPSQAAHVTKMARTGRPEHSSARTDSAAVAPVVSTSSTTTTSAFAADRAASGAARDTHIRPRRLCLRSPGDRPTESCTPRHTRNTGTSWQPSSDRTATAAVRTTGSPPRLRAAARRLGAGTSSNGTPGVRNRRRAPAMACPSGAARSVRPRSLSARTARRAGPAYRATAQHGTPGSVRGRSRSGGPASAVAHASHHGVPGRPQPPHATGRTRSRRVRMGTSVPGTAVARAAPRPCCAQFGRCPQPRARRNQPGRTGAASVPTRPGISVQ